MKRMTLAVLSACLVPFTSWAADDSARIRAIVDAAIRPLMAQHDVPGMAVAVTVDGKPLFFNYGLASREHHIPVSETTLFELGSISKVFTGTLGAYAQELGMLSLDDHPGKYMPELKGSAIDKASLLHLATYTAGGFPMQVPDEVSSDAQVPGYFKQWQPDAAPGTVRRYSNPSIGLFGHLAALALKRDFADTMQTQIFPQLGLKHSYIHVPQSAMADYAWGYDQANKPRRVKPGVFAAEAYGVKSSSADMIRFVQVNIDPGKLEEKTRRAVAGTQVGYFAVGDMVQGLGWEQYAYPISLERLLGGNTNGPVREQLAARPRAPSGPTLFGKTGSTGGFGNYVAFVPAHKIGIVMLANKSVPIPVRITAAHAILAQLIPVAQ